jgi:hypothetical protein
MRSQAEREAPHVKLSGAAETASTRPAAETGRSRLRGAPGIIASKLEAVYFLH